MIPFDPSPLHAVLLRGGRVCKSPRARIAFYCLALLLAGGCSDGPYDPYQRQIDNQNRALAAQRADITTIQLQQQWAKHATIYRAPHW